MAHRFSAEESAIFSVELADALKANVVGDGRCVHSLCQHAPACCLKAKLLLILERGLIAARGTAGGAPMSVRDRESE